MSSFEPSSEMDRGAPLKLNPILENLRSDHGKMEDLTHSFLVGLEGLGEETARLSRQLTEKDDMIALMADQTNLYRMASIEAQEKLDGVLRINNELRAELQGFKNFNAQLGQQYDDARGSVIKLSIQLEAAQNEINRLNFHFQETQCELNGLKTQVKQLYQVPNNATLEYSKLWPPFAGTAINGDALPTPPLATQDVPEQPPTPKAIQVTQTRSPSSDSKHPELVSSSSSATAFFIPPGVNQTKAATGPKMDHQEAAASKPKSKSIVRGGSRVDESFARIQNNLALTNKTNGSVPVRASNASNDPRVPTSLRDFSWPQATLVQHEKKTLNPECVPFVPPAAKSTFVSKLSPFSQEFIPAIGQPERSVGPFHNRVLRIPPSREDSSTANDLNKNGTMLKDRSRPAPSEPGMTTSQGPTPVGATTSTVVKPELAAVDSSSIPQGSLDTPAKTENVTSKVVNNVTITKNAKSIPPHLRGLPPKAPKLEPAVTLAMPFPPVAANAQLKNTDIIQAEAETMKAWLDTFEKHAMGQSVPDERSKSRPTSEGRLIDLDVEDTERSLNTDSAPGANVPANVHEVRNGLKDERYNLINSVDPYLQHLSREPTVSALGDNSAKIKRKQSNTPTPSDHQSVSVREADTTRKSEDDFVDIDEVDERVSKFKAQRPATGNESNIATDFLTAYNSKLSGVKSKYDQAVKSEKDFSSNGAPVEALYHKDIYLDPDYIAPSIVGTRELGKLLDFSTKSMILSETPNSRGRDMTKIGLEWKPAMKDGKTVFVL